MSKYTSTEKLLADTIREALRDLDQAFIEMRREGWHQSTDKNLRMVYLGVDAALKGQRQPYEATTAIINAPTDSQISRLPAWNGYPDEETQETPKGSAQ